jgi:hypothetical protein
MKKKLLILGLSCNADCYLTEEKLAFNTWAKPIKDKVYDNIELYFFRRGETEMIDEKKHVIFVDIADDLNHTYEKMYRAITIAKKEINFDYLVITNTATVLNLKLIDEFINSDVINDEKYYGGEMVLPVFCPVFFRGDFILLAKKKVEILAEKQCYCENDMEPFFQFMMAEELKSYDEFFKRMVQVKAVGDIKRININDIGSNFYVNCKAYDRKNSDAIIVNIVGVTSLIFSDKKKYDLKNLIYYTPKEINTNIGNFKIEKTDEFLK